MAAILLTLWLLVVDLFKSRSRLEAENLFLRHQLNIALRRAVRLSGGDRALLVLMTKLWPNLVGMARLVQPETILRWHRTGFGVFWRWKSRNRAGRPKIDRGASRIHGGGLAAARAPRATTPLPRRQGADYGPDLPTSRDPANAGAVAFKRAGDPNVGEFSDAVVLKKFGDVPK